MEAVNKIERILLGYEDSQHNFILDSVKRRGVKRRGAGLDAPSHTYRPLRVGDHIVVTKDFYIQGFRDQLTNLRSRKGIIRSFSHTGPSVGVQFFNRRTGALGSSEWLTTDCLVGIPNEGE